MLADLTHKGALYGMLSGAIFAIAAGTIREASKLIPDGDFWVRGITVLACMNTIQVVLMGLYLARRDRPQLGKVWVNWRSSIWVGIFSVLGSAGWANSSQRRIPTASRRHVVKVSVNSVSPAGAGRFCPPPTRWI